MDRNVHSFAFSLNDFFLIFWKFDWTLCYIWEETWLLKQSQLCCRFVQTAAQRQKIPHCPKSIFAADLHCTWKYVSLTSWKSCLWLGVVGCRSNLIRHSVPTLDTATATWGHLRFSPSPTLVIIVVFNKNLEKMIVFVDWPVGGRVLLGQCLDHSLDH